MPILPPSCASRPADCEQMCDQRRGGRFAVGAGDGDERRIRRELAPLAAEQLDVADHLDAGACAPARPTSAAPDGSAARRARAPARRSSTSRSRAGRRSAMPAARAFSTLAALSSKATTSAPPASSACALASPEPPSPNTRDLLSGKGGDRDHRSFERDSPASASTIAMIQNRITICGSVQPSCSK